MTTDLALTLLLLGSLATGWACGTLRGKAHPYTSDALRVARGVLLMEGRHGDDDALDAVKAIESIAPRWAGR